MDRSINSFSMILTRLFLFVLGSFGWGLGVVVVVSWVFLSVWGLRGVFGYVVRGEWERAGGGLWG